MPDFSLSCGCYVPEDSQPEFCAQHATKGVVLFKVVDGKAETLDFVFYDAGSWPPSWLGWEDGYGHGV